MREYTRFRINWAFDEPTNLSPGLSGALTSQVRSLIAETKAGHGARKTLPGTHDFATDKALWQYTQDLEKPVSEERTADQ